MFNYSNLYPHVSFNQWDFDQRHEIVRALRNPNGGLNSYLYVSDATVPSDLSASKDTELDRVSQIADMCQKERVDFIYGLSFPASFFIATQEKDKIREQIDKLKVIERMVAFLARNAGSTRLAFFFDDSPALHLPSTTSPTALSSGGKSSLLSSLHSYVANLLVEETLKRIKQAQHSSLKFYLMPLFYGKQIRETRTTSVNQGPSFGVHPKVQIIPDIKLCPLSDLMIQQQKEHESEMDRDVVQYWKEIDRNARSEFTFLFSDFISTEPRTKERPGSDTSGHSAARADGSVVAKLKQLVQQHKVILLDTFPSLIPTFKATATHTASFPAIPHLQGYEGTRYAMAADWAEGMAIQVAPALFPPHTVLIPLATAFDFLLSPNTHDPSISLKSGLLRLLQGEERLADEMLNLIESTPSPSSSASLATRKFKLKKLASPTFFQETADRLAYIRKNLSTLPLGSELQPLFLLVDAFLELNAANFEVEAFFEKQKQKDEATMAGNKKWDEFNKVITLLTLWLIS